MAIAQRAGQQTVLFAVGAMAYIEDTAATDRTHLRLTHRRVTVGVVGAAAEDPAAQESRDGREQARLSCIRPPR